jgi:hypothetical protein
VLPAARCRLLLAGFASAALLAAPACAAAAPAAGATGCPDLPLAQTFAPWGDTADYFVAPGGSFEQGATGWALRGGARVAGGNEPFRVVGAGDTRSLRMPARSAATSAPFCIGAEHRTMRFFARAAASRGSMNVDVLYTDADGTPRATRIGALAGAGRWAPTSVVPMVVNELAAAQGGAMTVRLRFAPRGKAAWTIDDVQVDPFRGR